MSEKIITFAVEIRKNTLLIKIHLAMKKQDVIERIQTNEVLVKVYEELAKVSQEIINQSNDPQLAVARDRYEKARNEWQEEQLRVLLEDKEFQEWQEGAFRKALYTFAAAIKCKSFVRWADDNGKSADRKRVDSLSKAGKYLGDLYKDYKSGAKVAKAKIDHLAELRKQLAAAEELQAKIKAELESL